MTDPGKNVVLMKTDQGDQYFSEWNVFWKHVNVFRSYIEEQMLTFWGGNAESGSVTNMARAQNPQGGSVSFGRRWHSSQCSLPRHRSVLFVLKRKLENKATDLAENNYRNKQKNDASINSLSTPAYPLWMVECIPAPSGRRWGSPDRFGLTTLKSY